MISKTRINILKITLGGLFLALGLLIPQIFHVFGPNVGQTLLPMHLSVLCAGLILGYNYGLIIGAFTPILSFLLTGMPPMPIIVFMIVELAIYGFTSGLFYKKLKFNLYLSLILSLICGRVAYALTLLVMGNLLGMNVPKVIMVIGTTIDGLPGIALQIIIVPIIVVALKKGGFYGEKRLRERKGDA